MVSEGRGGGAQGAGRVGTVDQYSCLPSEYIPFICLLYINRSLKLRKKCLNKIFLDLQCIEIEDDKLSFRMNFSFQHFKNFHICDSIS